MRRARSILLAAVLLGGCGGDDRGAGETAVTIELAETNASGQSGTATLTPKEGKIETFEVAVTVSPPSPDIQPAAIHRVTCAEYDPDIPEGASLDEIFAAVSATAEDELGEVRDGRARATVPEALADRLTGGYALMVHGPSPPYEPVVCGDIPAGE